MKGLGVGIAHDGGRVPHGNLMRGGFGILKFIKEQLLHDVRIQLLPRSVGCHETLVFKATIPLIGVVPITFGAGAATLINKISRLLQFVGHGPPQSYTDLVCTDR